MPPVTPPLIRIAAVALLRDDHVLLVRKRGTDAFMLPGGKFEPEEAAIDTVCRELREELGIAVSPQALELLGSFTAPAAHEPDHDVLAIVFLAELADCHRPRPRAEIEDLRLEPLTSRAANLAPLVSQWVLPALRRLPWGAPA